MNFSLRFTMAGISLAALSASSLAGGPMGTWMLTDGDNKTDALIQGGNVNTYAQDPLSNRQYPIQWDPSAQLFETVGRDQNGLGGVYDINHNSLGQFSNNTSLAPPTQHLDGTLDTKDNMSVAAAYNGGGGSDMVIGYNDGLFNGPTHTIWTSPNDYVLSVTYAQSTGDLYVGQTGMITIITPQGVNVGSFATLGGSYVRSLAYDASDNSLWYLSGDGNTAIQSDLTGNVLQTETVNLGGNYWGGEIAPVPEPMPVLALGGGLLLVLRRRRSR